MQLHNDVQAVFVFKDGACLGAWEEETRVGGRRNLSTSPSWIRLLRKEYGVKGPPLRLERNRIGGSKISH